MGIPDRGASLRDNLLMKDHGVFSIKLLILSDHLPKAAALCSNQQISPFFLGLGLRPIHACTSNSYKFIYQ